MDGVSPVSLVPTLALSSKMTRSPFSISGFSARLFVGAVPSFPKHQPPHSTQKLTSSEIKYPVLHQISGALLPFTSVHLSPLAPTAFHSVLHVTDFLTIPSGLTFFISGYCLALVNRFGVGFIVTPLHSFSETKFPALMTVALFLM